MRERQVLAPSLHGPHEMGRGLLAPARRAAVISHGGRGGFPITEQLWSAAAKAGELGDGGLKSACANAVSVSAVSWSEGDGSFKRGVIEGRVLEGGGTQVYPHCSLRDRVFISHAFTGREFGPAQAFHGSTLLVDATFFFSSAPSPGDGSAVILPVSFERLQSVLRNGVESVRRCNLDRDLPKAQGENTTIEWMSKYLWEEIVSSWNQREAPECKETGQHLAALSVVIHESDLVFASYAKAMEGASETLEKIAGSSDSRKIRPPSCLSSFLRGPFGLTVKDRALVARETAEGGGKEGATLLVSASFFAERLRGTGESESKIEGMGGPPLNFVIDVGEAFSYLRKTLTRFDYSDLSTLPPFRESAAGCAERVGLQSDSSVARLVWESLVEEMGGVESETLSGISGVSVEVAVSDLESARYFGSLCLGEKSKPAAGGLPANIENVVVDTEGLLRILHESERGERREDLTGWTPSSSAAPLSLLLKVLDRLQRDAGIRLSSWVPTESKISLLESRERWLERLGKCDSSVKQTACRLFSEEWEGTRRAPDADTLFVRAAGPDHVESSGDGLTFSVSTLKDLQALSAWLAGAVAPPPHLSGAIDRLEGERWTLEPHVYLEAKAKTDAHAFNEDVWDRFTGEIRGAELGPLGVLRGGEGEEKEAVEGFAVLDVGAGRLSMFSRLSAVWGSLQTKGRGDVLLYVAVERDENTAKAACDFLGSLPGVKEGGWQFEGGEMSRSRLFEKRDRRGDTLLAVVNKSADQVAETLSGWRSLGKGVRVDAVVGCSVADLFGPRVLPEILKRAAPGALVYLPISFEGRTAREPAFEGDGLVPSDRQVAATYHAALKSGGQFFGEGVLQGELEKAGFQILAEGESPWRVETDVNPEMCRALTHFVGMSVGPQLFAEGWDFVGWLSAHADGSSCSSFVIANRDVLARAPAESEGGHKAVVFTGPRQVSVGPPPAPATEVLEHDEFEAVAEASCISSGTEMNVFRGEIDNEGAAWKLDETIKGLDAETGGEGGSAWPVSYGYCWTGRVVRRGRGVSEDLLGKRVFVFAPHGNKARARGPILLSSLHRESDRVGMGEGDKGGSGEGLTGRQWGALEIPEGLSFEDACFLPAAETAVSFAQDASLLPGENVAVVGGGVVGALTVAALKRSVGGAVGSRVRCVEPQERRRRVARACGADECLSPTESVYPSRPFDVVIEVSGRTEGLGWALRHTAKGGRVVMGSWYPSGRGAGRGATEAPQLPLGIPDVHRSHLTLKFSQVSEIPPGLGGGVWRWTKERRFNLAWRLLLDLKPASVFSNEGALARASFEDAAKAYEAVDKGGVEAPVASLFFYT
uniref:6-pyruvoyltetrahydropterin synthase n=1 Tax=Chromera velia CCMP2878 TaxID=1169474 RepID=A0A0G4F2G1_9ALVE|eukprot:Cvel_2635.t1-p1 / transcript=Cvel_2635.t1 / gene=Cvel_2635 / organism=Chromera_velia_CCMP2878 / gene_product=hypothetical protein / transcript_product=hypothetical protein / location=Cvel_scaffold104:77078-84087(+) / protein_length=1332 / sequence_SO=supercontig / SO=protein_coding / is_pseudo=false